MKFSTAIFTQPIKNLQDLNREIRLKLSYMPSYILREMQDLEQLSAEMLVLAKRLEADSLMVSQHLELLLRECREMQRKESLKD